MIWRWKCRGRKERGDQSHQCEKSRITDPQDYKRIQLLRDNHNRWRPLFMTQPCISLFLSLLHVYVNLLYHFLHWSSYQMAHACLAVFFPHASTNRFILGYTLLEWLFLYTCHEDINNWRKKLVSFVYGEGGRCCFPNVMCLKIYFIFIFL